jgi:hypothetical protein
MVLAAATLAQLGCGADEKESGDCTVDGATVEITDNHRTSGGDHKFVVSAEDVIAGDEIVYDIRGDNTGHTHSVTVTADDFSTLQDGDSVTIESSDTGAAGNDHTHDIILSCPA